MKIERIGDGFAVRLPDDMVEGLALQEGDEVSLYLQKRQKPLTDAERKEAIEGLRRYRGMMPADFKFDRDEANAR